MILPTSTTVTVADGETVRMFHKTGVKSGCIWSRSRQHRLRPGPLGLGYAPSIREVIALAFAITLHRDGCIAVHSEAAVKHGATKEELAEARAVAFAVNARAALGILRSRVLACLLNIRVALCKTQ